MEKRIDELRTRSLKNRNKLAAFQAHERKMRKERSLWRKTFLTLNLKKYQSSC